MVSVIESSDLVNPFTSTSTSTLMASPATSSDSSAPFASTVPAAPQPAPTSVVQTVNIRSHVPVLLDMVELNYTQWWCIFDFVLGKFGLDNHIHSPPALAQRDGDLVMNNHSVVNWIYTTMNKAVFNTVYKPHASAFTIWTDVEGLFRDNEMQRAIYLEAEFRKIHQGDMSITQYYTKLKTSPMRCATLTNPCRSLARC